MSADAQFYCSEAPVGRFRNILINNGIQKKLFQQVIDILSEKGLILKRGTIVDSTLIAAPSASKNKEKKRDPEAHSVKKGNQWHFDYKVHIRVDKDNRLVYHVEATVTNVHDASRNFNSITTKFLHNIKF